MSKNRYSAEFKKAAARLIIIGGMSVSEASKKLGVSPAQLYKWRDAHLEGLANEADFAPQATSKNSLKLVMDGDTFHWEPKKN
jgi:transposase-like protein